MVQVCGREPLINVSQDLGSILNGICSLLEIQELVAQVQNGSDLHAILEQNILDSCQWVSNQVLRTQSLTGHDRAQTQPKGSPASMHWLTDKCAYCITSI